MESKTLPKEDEEEALNFASILNFGVRCPMQTILHNQIWYYIQTIVVVLYLHFYHYLRFILGLHTVFSVLLRVLWVEKGG